MVTFVRERRAIRGFGILAVLLALAGAMAFSAGAASAASVQNLKAGSISAGGGHSCAVRANGQALCWGRNDHGQLGDNTVIDRNKPVPVRNLTDAVSISAGFGHTCAIRSNGQAVCWGRNSSGQLGDGTTTERHTPVPVQNLAGATGIAAGGSYAAGFSCAVKAGGQAVCWGSNSQGQLGDNGGLDSQVPVNVQGLADATAITTGYAHACAIRSGGQAVCWGENDRGQIGDGTQIDRPTITPVNNALPPAARISAGRLHTCAISAPMPATAYCWGGNTDGQLGNNTQTDSLVPVPVPLGGGGIPTRIAAGQNSTCAVTGGLGSCWGKNDHGQIGDGTNTSPRTSPVPVIGLNNATEITVGGGDAYAGGSGSGGSHACALQASTEAVCWGENLAGQLGDGSNTERNLMDVIPTQLYDLLATVSGSGSGTVTSTPTGIVCGLLCQAPFDENSTVTVTAAPDNGSVFLNWAGACTGTNPVCSVDMTADKVAKATFAALFPLTVTKGGPGSGRVDSSPAGIDCGSTCSSQFVDMTSVTLTATPDPHMRFVQWGGTGACGGSPNPVCTVTMDQARQALAIFDYIYHPVTVSKAGSGNGQVVSSPTGISCDPTCTAPFREGDTITLTATPGINSAFTGWTGDCSGTNPVCQVTVNGPVNATAHFEPGWNLHVSRTGPGTGKVQSSPSGIDCGPDCNEQYLDMTAVTLTAIPDPGMRFMMWAVPGDCSGTNPVCNLTMSQARSAVAVFDYIYHPVTVSKTGSGSGLVTSSPGTISCDPACTDQFQEGSVVTLTATPGMGSVFAGWSGDCSGQALTCAITVGGAVNVTARFDPLHPLSVTKSGSGTGTVTSAPPGINCGMDCNWMFAEGTQVTLTATPGLGSAFKQWTGACTGSGATCQVTMAAARNVDAEFMQVRNLAVTRSGAGSGSITSSPAGITCGGSCSGDFEAGSIVTITANPSPGSVFTGWDSGPGGPCSGTNPVCAVKMTANFTVDAAFAKVRHPLSVTRAGAGQGSVTSTPAGIDCGATCSADFDENSVVTLTATADNGSLFTGWSGACSGEAADCQVTMSQARSVTATFGQPLPPVQRPTETTSAYDPATGRLEMWLKCPKAAKPKCNGTAVAVTSKAKNAREMSSRVRTTWKAGKAKIITITIKPPYRHRVALMTTVDRKQLIVRQPLLVKKGKKKKKLTIYHIYKVRMKS